MKKIQAVPIWFNGQDVNATLLNVVVSSVILGRAAMVQYQLFSSVEDMIPDVILQSGSLSLDGIEYEDWGSDDEYVWNWAASKLNLTIVGNN